MGGWNSVFSPGSLSCQAPWVQGRGVKNQSTQKSFIFCFDWYRLVGISKFHSLDLARTLKYCLLGFFCHSGYARQFELPGPSVQGRGIKIEISQKSSMVCFIWLKPVWKTKFHCPGLVRTINSCVLWFLAVLCICGISSCRASFVQAWGVKYWYVDDCVVQIED